MTLSSLFIVCSHGRRSAHEYHEQAFQRSVGKWCPGGRPATTTDLEELGEKVWVCVETRDDGTKVEQWVELGNRPDHGPHSESCGWRILIPLPQMVAGESL